MIPFAWAWWRSYVTRRCGGRGAFRRGLDRSQEASPIYTSLSIDGRDEPMATTSRTR
jgi:hypothetical protein